MSYVMLALLVAVLVLNGFHLVRLLRRPSGARFGELFVSVALLGASAFVFYDSGSFEVSEHEILVKSDGTVVTGPASGFELGGEFERIVLAREDCVFEKIEHGKDMVAVTVRYRTLDSVDARKLFETISASKGLMYPDFRNHLKSAIRIPAEIPSNEALIALALQASFLKYREAGVLVTVQSVVVIEDGATMRRFRDE